MDKCPNCKRRFSDWFLWGGWRHCFPCWRDSGFLWTWLENGKRIYTGR